MCGQVFQVKQTTLFNTSGALWMIWKKVPNPKSLQLLCNSQTCNSYDILWAPKDCLPVNYTWYFSLFPCMKPSVSCLPWVKLEYIISPGFKTNLILAIFYCWNLLSFSVGAHSHDVRQGFFPPHSFGERVFASRLTTQITCTVLCRPSPISFLGRQWSLRR